VKGYRKKRGDKTLTLSWAFPPSIYTNFPDNHGLIVKGYARMVHNVIVRGGKDNTGFILLYYDKFISSFSHSDSSPFYLFQIFLFENGLYKRKNCKIDLTR